MIFKWVYILGRHFRNPSSKSIQQFLLQSNKYTLNQLETYQLQKLKELVSHAYNYSEHYRKSFDKKKVCPTDIKKLSDLEKLPIITKLELITFNSEIQSNFKFKKTFTAKTSGTSGESLVFERNEYSDSFNRTVINYNYNSFNVKPWFRNGYFWGFNSTFKQQIRTKILDAIQNRFRVFSYSESEMTKFIKKLNKAKYLHGYSSSIYQTAQEINKGSFKKPNKIMMVKGTSEKIFDYYQPEIIKAFGSKMISEYGAAESGIIAFECPQGNMHLNMEGVIVEEVNEEILVTNLHMLSFPIIRYKLGDYIKLASKTTSCVCGKRHVILSEVMGRIGETVYGVIKIYPSLYFYYIFKNISQTHKINLEYQVIQKEKGKLTFNIASVLTHNEKKILANEIDKYFKKDIHYTINSEVKIKGQNKKRKSFISDIKE
jgi:phenylacetate-CoA ligase